MCVPRTDVCCEWVSCPHTPSTISQMMQVAMSSNSFAIVKLATAKLKMKMLPKGFRVALCSTAIQFSDRRSIRSFLALQIEDFVVDAVDVVDVSVSEIVAFLPGEHLAFSGIVLLHGQNLVAVEKVSGAHQHSNEESPCFAFCNRFRSARVAEKSSLSRALRSKSIISFSPILCSANDFRYPSCSYHLESIVGWLPCFSCLAFLSICFALKNMICLSHVPCFGPRLEFFLMTKLGIEVKSQLVFWSVVGLREVFKFHPQLQ